MGDAMGHEAGGSGVGPRRGARRWAVRLTGAVAAVVALLGCTGLPGSTPADSVDTTDSTAPEAGVPLDVLLVFDNSGSMADEGAAVLLSAAAIVDALGDADWRLGVTTTSAHAAYGPTAGTDPGEAGTLAGDYIEPGEGAADALREQLACSVIYFKESDLPADPFYEGEPGDCATPESGSVGREYLDCLCPDGWNMDEGSGTEEGLEAAVDALCRGEAPPEACFNEETPITEADAGTVDLWRVDSRRRIWVISDEGDGSRRQQTADPSADAYLSLFDQLGEPRFSVVGPYFGDDGDGSCLDGAQTWGVQRYQAAAEATGGAYLALTGGPATDCAAVDVGTLFAEALREDL